MILSGDKITIDEHILKKEMELFKGKEKQILNKDGELITVKGTGKNGRFKNCDLADILHYSWDKSITIKGGLSLPPKKAQMLADFFEVNLEYLTGESNLRTIFDEIDKDSNALSNNRRIVLEYFKSLGLEIDTELRPLTRKKDISATDNSVITETSYDNDFHELYYCIKKNGTLFCEKTETEMNLFIAAFNAVAANMIDPLYGMLYNTHSDIHLPHHD